MGELVNQHELARRIKRSRVSIIRWARQGLPVAQKGPPGTQTLYDLDQVIAWLRQTGNGARPDLPPIPAAENRQLERILGTTLERALPACLALMLAHGLHARAALQVFDEVLIALYLTLEGFLGREAQLPLDGALGALLDRDSEAQLIEGASRLAEELRADGCLEPGA